MIGSVDKDATSLGRPIVDDVAGDGGIGTVHTNGELISSSSGGHVSDSVAGDAVAGGVATVARDAGGEDSATIHSVTCACRVDCAGHFNPVGLDRIDRISGDGRRRGRVDADAERAAVDVVIGHHVVLVVPQCIGPNLDGERRDRVRVDQLDDPIAGDASLVAGINSGGVVDVVDAVAVAGAGGHIDHAPLDYRTIHVSSRTPHTNACDSPAVANDAAIAHNHVVAVAQVEHLVVRPGGVDAVQQQPVWVATTIAGSLDGGAVGPCGGVTRPKVPPTALDCDVRRLDQHHGKRIVGAAFQANNGVRLSDNTDRGCCN